MLSDPGPTVDEDDVGTVGRAGRVGDAVHGLSKELQVGAAGPALIEVSPIEVLDTARIWPVGIVALACREQTQPALPRVLAREQDRGGQWRTQFGKGSFRSNTGAGERVLVVGKKIDNTFLSFEGQGFPLGVAGVALEPGRF